MRSFGLISLVAALAIVAFAWSRAAHDAAGPTSLGAQGDAAKVAAAFSLQQSGGAMELWRSTNGTYAGALLPAANGVVVVRADASSYCLQGGVAPNVQHLDGPGGNAPIDGPC